MQGLKHLAADEDEFEINTFTSKRKVSNKQNNRKVSMNEPATTQPRRRNRNNHNHGKSVKPYTRQAQNKTHTSSGPTEELTEESSRKYSDFEFEDTKSFASNCDKQFEDWRQGAFGKDKEIDLKLQIADEDGLLTSYLSNKEGKPQINMI